MIKEIDEEEEKRIEEESNQIKETTRVKAEKDVTKTLTEK